MSHSLAKISFFIQFIHSGLFIFADAVNVIFEAHSSQ